jgi:acetylornithine aminotransferase
MLARAEIAASFSPGTHGSTFGGNPLMTTAALATVRTLLEEHLLERAVEMGAYLTAELQKLQARFAVIQEVRGIGLMIGVGLSIPGAEIVKMGHARGLLLNCTHETVLRFVPPLVVTKAEIDEMIALLTAIFEEVQA